MAYILVVNPITLTLQMYRIYQMHYEWIMVQYLLQQPYLQQLVLLLWGLLLNTRLLLLLVLG